MASNTLAGAGDGLLEHDIEEKLILKRLPNQFPRRKNHIYVTRRTAFPQQIKRCQKLLEMGFTEIFIHGLGSAISRAINIGLQLEAQYNGALRLDLNTSTLELVDDVQQQSGEGNHTTQTRNNSAVHIKLTLSEPEDIK